MTKVHKFGLLATLFLVVGLVGLFFYLNRVVPATVVEFVVTPYTNSENVSVTMSDADQPVKSTFSGVGYIDLPLTTGTSTTESKYLNQETQIEIWIKNDEISVFRFGDLVFQGIKGINPPLPPLTSKPTPERPEFLTMLTDFTWQWVFDESNKALTEDFTVTHSTDGTLKITTNCNEYAGTYTLSGQELNYDILPTTNLACTNVTLDSIFIYKMSEVSSATVLENMDLVLNYGDKNDRLIFRMQLFEML